MPIELKDNGTAVFFTGAIVMAPLIIAIRGFLKLRRRRQAPMSLQTRLWAGVFTTVRPKEARPLLDSPQRDEAQNPEGILRHKTLAKV